MPVSPQVLQAIASPTGGKLTDIGQIYAKSKQQATENARAAAKDKQITEKYEFDRMDRGSKAVLGLSTDAIKWHDDFVTQNQRKPSNEEFKVFQDEQYANAPDVLKEYAKEDFQSYEQYQVGRETAVKLQESLHPVEAKAFKPDYEVGIAINKTDPTKKTYARTRDGVAEVQLPGGKWRPLEVGTELFLKGDATLTKEQLGGLSGGTDLELFKEDKPVVEFSDERAASAAVLLPRINLSIDMYKKGLIEGGALTEFMGDFKNYYKTITGFDFTGGDDPTSVVVAISTAKEMQLQKTMMLKGAVSDKEQVIASQASGISANNPKQGALLNLKIIKMASLRDADYNTKMRSYIAKQRVENKKPSLDTFAGEYDKANKKLPGIVSQTQKVDGRAKIQYLFHWEQKDKELAAVRAELISQQIPLEQQQTILDGVGEKFDSNWAKKYGR